MKIEFPENWVIDTEKEKESPLMSKFMEWFEKNKTAPLSNTKYFGIFVGTVSDWNFTNCQFKLITLEQWHKAYFSERYKEWQPKEGERILVSDDNEYFYETTFALMYKGEFYSSSSIDPRVLHGRKYAKPLESPKESILVPIVEQLKAEAKKLGIENVKITFE